MQHRWQVPHPRGAVYDVLADADRYPQWWPQVREAVRIDAHSGRARLRSALPISLSVELSQAHRDPVLGVLRASVRGDLVGWSQWTVEIAPEGSIVTFDQEVDFTKPMPTATLVALRPLMVANHRYMMWSGRRGLVRHLSSAGTIAARHSQHVRPSSG